MENKHNLASLFREFREVTVFYKSAIQQSWRGLKMTFQGAHLKTEQLSHRESVEVVIRFVTFSVIQVNGA